MALGLIIFILSLGFIFLLLEILVMPGFLLGVFGVAIMAFGIYEVYSTYGEATGNWTFAGVFALTIVSVFLALKSGVWQRMALKDTISAKAIEEFQDNFKMGDTGITVSALRPSGNVLIGKRRVECTTNGESIDSGENVVILKIVNNKIIVKSITS